MTGRRAPALDERLSALGCALVLCGSTTASQRRLPLGYFLGIAAISLRSCEQCIMCAGSDCITIWGAGQPSCSPCLQPATAAAAAAAWLWDRVWTDGWCFQARLWDGRGFAWLWRWWWGLWQHALWRRGSCRQRLWQHAFWRRGSCRGRLWQHAIWQRGSYAAGLPCRNPFRPAWCGSVWHVARAAAAATFGPALAFRHAGASGSAFVLSSHHRCQHPCQWRWHWGCSHPSLAGICAGRRCSCRGRGGFCMAGASFCQGEDSRGASTTGLLPRLSIAAWHFIFDYLSAGPCAVSFGQLAMPHPTPVVRALVTFLAMSQSFSCILFGPP
jgi:hypothetical protein